MPNCALTFYFNTTHGLRNTRSLFVCFGVFVLVRLGRKLLSLNVDTKLVVYCVIVVLTPTMPLATPLAPARDSSLGCSISGSSAASHNTVSRNLARTQTLKARIWKISRFSGSDFGCGAGHRRPDAVRRRTSSGHRKSAPQSKSRPGSILFDSGPCTPFFGPNSG